MTLYTDLDIHRQVHAVPAHLDSPELYLRQDAAFALALEGRPPLAHPDPQVRKHALLGLQRTAEGGRPPLDSGTNTPTGQRLELDLADPDPACRQLAASLTLPHLQTAELAWLLGNAHDDVKAQTAHHISYREDLEPAPLAEPLLVCSRSADPELRRRALSGLAWLARRGWERELQVQRLAAALADPAEIVRRHSLLLLPDLEPLPQGVVEAALPAFATDCYCVLQFLRRVLGRHDVRPFYPAMLQVLLNDRSPWGREAGQVLQRAVASGQVTPGLVAELAPGLQLRSEQPRASVVGCLASLASQDADLEPALEEMLEGLSAARPTHAEHLLTPVLADYLVRRSDYERLERLLAAPDASVSGVTAQRLARSSLALGPLLPALRRLSQSPHRFSSDAAREALERP